MSHLRFRALLASVASLLLLAGVSAGAPRPAAAQQPAAGTMKAIRVHAHGGPEVLKYEEAPRPTPGAGEMLVRVHAAGVNPVDAAVRRGGMGRTQVPFTPGYDVSGVVEQVGEGVTKFKLGDAVFAYKHLSRPGAYAEYALVREEEAAAKPENLSHADAAGVPLAALTAWQALFDKANLKEGQTVLIHAGAGGVGSYAVQLAKWKGARVIATASARNHDYLRDLGADEVIDYTKDKFEEKAKDVDVVLDPIGGDTQERSWQTLKRGGTLVSIIQPPDQARAQEHGVSAHIFLVQPNAEQLAQIAALLAEGKIRAVTTQKFPLSEAARAHEQIETRHTRGKIVLEIVKPQE